MCFIPDNSTRKHLVPPTQINVDFRAACFCHKRIVDIGFVCSICLSSQCPISFLEGDTERHEWGSLGLAPFLEHTKGTSQQCATASYDESVLESSESSIEDANFDVTLIVDWWLDGVRPNHDNRLQEVDSLEVTSTKRYKHKPIKYSNKHKAYDFFSSSICVWLCDLMHEQF